MKLIVDFTNGSKATYEHPSMTELYEAANRLSYSGGKIKRVEIETEPNSFRPLWDRTWDELSQNAGLQIPK